MPRILVLDDNVLISTLLEEWLVELGCEVAGPAGSVASALQIIDQTVIDAAFLDVSVGDGHCYPVVLALEQRGVPFTLATGGSIHGLEPRLKGAAVMMKPYDFVDVKGAVDRMLGIRA